MYADGCSCVNERIRGIQNSFEYFGKLAGKQF